VGKIDLRACVERLRDRPEPPPLVPRKSWDAKLDDAIERAIPDDAGPDLRAVKSALFLWNDNLKRAHELAQETETQTGSYLHGVMHRREPDYPNSKYWFRRVGHHPAMDGLREAALEVMKGAPVLLEALGEKKKWDAFRMVDWCEEAESDPKLRELLERLQAREIEALADFCLRQAKL
jgi:hypothetical protein